MRHSLPTRSLRERPDLQQLRRQAKELLEAFAAGEAAAAAEVNTHFRAVDAAAFALHDAQLVLARAYGFESWPKLKAYVDGVTVGRLVDAVRAGDLAQVRAMLDVRPELAHMGVDNIGAIHHAILNRAPEMVRLLMEKGANAREGVYPHREATSGLTMATERGYDEIVAIIHEVERRRAHRDLRETSPPDAVFEAIAAGDREQVAALLVAAPALIRGRHPVFGWTPLHLAAVRLSTEIVELLLDHGGDVGALAQSSGFDVTPLDLAAQRPGGDSAAEFKAVARLLRERGATLTARAAAALGDADWLRGRQSEGVLMNPIQDSGGLLRIAVSHDRPEILELLLNFGFDPDERTRFGDGDELTFTWGMPLWHCAGSGKYAMAEMLLRRGADPNAQVYASGDPMFQAHSEDDGKMVELLERYGGVTNATTAGLFRQTQRARMMLAGEVKYRLDGVGGETLAEQLLWGAACGGDPEIVEMALERVDWRRDDPRWFGILEQPLRIWRHGSASRNWDRGTYLACFRLLLARCDPNLRGRAQDLGGFGLTILHSVAGSREHITPEERVEFAAMLLDAGARMDVRDNLLKSTPLGWACRWGRVELVKLMLERGADPVEADAESWATPRAWAEKMKRPDILAKLGQSGG